MGDVMSKKLQCSECRNAEYGEELYMYDGELLCRFCIVSKLCEGAVSCEYYGECNDTKKLVKNKDCDKCTEKDQRIAELEKENAENNAQKDIIHSLTNNNGKIDMTVSGNSFKFFMCSIIQILEQNNTNEEKNFLVIDLEKEDKHYSITIQDCNKELTLSKKLNSLKQENEQLKQQLKNIESDHELLINDFDKQDEYFRKQIKHERDARKRFIVENEKLKQQLAQKDKQLAKAEQKLKELKGSE
jgi:hypothetical protein